MSLTLSTMQKLGSSAPNFSLPDVRTSTTINLSDHATQPLLIMFICNHCPYVVHLIQPLAELANRYQQAGYAAIAISSNDMQSHPQDSPENMKLFSEQHGFEFAYCYDGSQQTAKAYDAACTPDFFIYDRDHKLRYRGQMDGSRPANDVAITGADLKAALDAVLNGDDVSEQQLPSVGCNIKWKSEVL